MALEPMIGLEVHAQLDTKSKMFCQCSTEFGAEPNSNVCPTCLGLPGSLPVPNRTAVEYTIRTGVALHCQVAERCRFARKNYFYPDLPKNFQISQYDEPLTHDGYIDLTVDGEEVRIGIRRAHLEEDTGKNIHLPSGSSLVEYNRCGIPLMEVVTEPDFTTAEQCREYLTQLRLILRCLGVSNANMEEGAMRAEPTVNLRDPQTGEATPKVEIKNLNSIRSVYEAVKYEIERQRRAVREGREEELFQQTRRWDEDKGVTTLMRRKETSDDYMYFPEPDLVPLEPDPEWVQEIIESCPELPAERCRRLCEQYGLPEYDAEVLTESRELADFFEDTCEHFQGAAKTVSNWLMGDVMSLLNEAGVSITESPISSQGLAELLTLIEEDVISGKIAKDVLATMFETGRGPREIVEEEGLEQISDAGELEGIIEQVIADNPGPAEQFRSGKDKAIGFLIGQVMKATQGQANPQMVNEIMREKLQ
ncbi:MAG: Asp-tRNA(Asn)/Glu-tRNA(Gln) amidotransferase subunit GatB [Armatimonadota bacterium]|nr:Asp-tRNA(Asn)/Glu-tRNA(Gln) amidotransferase subunit GatB [Armatimonadota bacterium]